MVVRKSIYAILLLSLVALKVSSATIHIHLHHDDEGHDEPCELCESAISNQLMEFSAPVEFDTYEAQDVLVFRQQEQPYESAAIATFLDSTLLVRPPPSLSS